MKRDERLSKRRLGLDENVESGMEFGRKEWASTHHISESYRESRAWQQETSLRFSITATLCRHCRHNIKLAVSPKSSVC